MKMIRLLGMVLLATALQSSQARQASPVTVIYSFRGHDGAQPETGLALGIDGNFYGTTALGGANNLGTIYTVTPSGALTTLHSFAPGEGSNVAANLVLGTNSDFYGTTFVGGANDLGTVFEISTSGVFSTLYEFSGPDGSHPGGALFQGTDGNFYGTTVDGGLANSGTVFQITPAGTLTTLYNFDSSTNGGAPRAGLVQGSDGDFYGTTSNGGTNKYGTVFKITASGSLTTLFHFGRGNDGRRPAGDLVEATNDVFFGATFEGGQNNLGTIFRITASGDFTNLFHFTSPDGEHPTCKLAPGSDGFLYGMARGKGFGFGTVFMIGSNGAFTRLYAFGGSTDGGFPYSGLVFGNDGFLYGTTAFGGVNLHGVIFRFSGTPVGTYSGLVLQTNAPSHESSGLINVTLVEDRSFTANLTLGGVRSGFKGAFDFSGNATNVVALKNQLPVQIALHLGSTNGSTVIAGDASNDLFRSDLSASLSVFNKTNKFSGSTARYTLVLQPLDTNDTSVPQGFGYATLTVKKTGEGKLQGVLADGTKIKAEGSVLIDGTWPFYAALYSKHGACLGSILFATNNTLGATVDWFKPARPVDKFYPAGFTTTTTLDGVLYLSPTNGSPAVITTNQLTLGGGNLPAPIVRTVIIDASGAATVTNPGNDRLTLAVDPRTGQFSGRFLNTGTGKTSAFNGVLLQSNQSGAGFFLGTNQSGFVVLEPAP
jgi:uncharacterized repeat protein (TIGR03803 family)